jgi:anti-sigma factor RsiW
VVSGRIKPQGLAGSPEELQGFFAGKTDFSVVIPELSGFTLLGGALNDHAGTALAHVVYAHDNEVLYMYETCWNTVKQGQKLHIPARAKEELLRTGWFSETGPNGESLVLWTDGNTLCAAVARMEKSDLIARLASSKGKAGKQVW